MKQNRNLKATFASWSCCVHARRLTHSVALAHSARGGAPEHTRAMNCEWREQWRERELFTQREARLLKQQPALAPSSPTFLSHSASNDVRARLYPEWGDCQRLDKAPNCRDSDFGKTNLDPVSARTSSRMCSCQTGHFQNSAVMRRTLMK